MSQLYPHMLIEDVGLRVMPLGRRWTERVFSVDLEPSSGRLETLISEALHPETPDDLTDAACDFFRDCAQVVMTYGRAIFEIVYLRDDAGAVARIAFDYVPPLDVELRDDEVIQHVPPEIAEQRGRPSEIQIPLRDVIVFESPLPIKTHQRILDALADVGRPMLPDFVQEEMRGEARVGYSSADDVRFKKLALAEVCREIGWDGRGMFREEFLEYYELVRRLRFESFLVHLRELMVDSMNGALESVGNVLNETSRLRITGLPSDDDISTARLLLEDGGSDFKALLEPFSLR